MVGITSGGEICVVLRAICTMNEASIPKWSTKRLIQLKNASTLAQLQQRRRSERTASGGHGSQAPNGVHISLLSVSLLLGVERRNGGCASLCPGRISPL